MFYNNIDGKQIKDPGLAILYGKLDYWVKRENRRVFGEEKIMIEEKEGDESRDSTNKLVILYKDWQSFRMYPQSSPPEIKIKVLIFI